MQSGDCAWPSIGSFPLGREYSKYILDMPSSQYYVNLQKKFGLKSRTAFFPRTVNLSHKTSELSGNREMAKYGIASGRFKVPDVHPKHTSHTMVC